MDDDDEIKSYLTQKIELILKLIEYLNEQKSLECNSEDLDIIKITQKSLKMAKSKIAVLKTILSKNKIFAQDMINCNQVIVEFFAFVDEFSGSPQLQKTFNEICLDKNNDSWEKLEYYSNDFTREVEKSTAILNESVVISCDLPSFDTLPVEVCQYISTGEKIKNAPEIQAIKNELLTLEISAAIPSIYVAIVGPSFMGKTQTAFALSHSLNLLYVNLSVIYSDTISAAQPIYSPFAKISKIFTACLQKDMKMIINALEGSFSAAVLSIGGPFLTLGLIYHLICLDKPSSVEEWVLQYINVSDVSVTKLTVSQFDQQIKSKNISLWVVINIYF